jgi:hypothetical protein
MAKAKTNDAAEAAQQIDPKAGHTFKLGKVQYKYVLPKFIIPGVGLRTALEACSDDTKYPELGGQTINEYLVEVKSGCIAES